MKYQSISTDCDQGTDFNNVVLGLFFSLLVKFHLKIMKKNLKQSWLCVKRKRSNHTKVSEYMLFNRTRQNDSKCMAVLACHPCKTHTQRLQSVVFPLSFFSLQSNCFFIALKRPRSEELRTQNLESHLMRTQSLKVLPLKPGVGQYIAMHATLTARDFFLYPSGPFICIFQKPLLSFSCVSCS